MRGVGWLGIAVALGSACGPVVTVVDDAGDGDGVDDDAHAGGDGDGDGDDGDGDSDGDGAAETPAPVAFFAPGPEGNWLFISSYTGAGCIDGDPPFDFAPSDACEPFVQWAVIIILPFDIAPGEYVLTDLIANAYERPALSNPMCDRYEGSHGPPEGTLRLDGVGSVIEGVLSTPQVVFESGPIDLRFVAERC